MEKYTLIKRNNSLEIRKVSMIRHYTKGLVVVSISFSILSLAFATGYIGTFLLFR